MNSIIRFMFRPAVSLIAGAALLTGCGGGNFSRFHDMDTDRGWAYTDTVRFDASRRDSVSEGDLSVAVRHNNDYPYANLWLEVSYMDGTRNCRDTVNIRLADLYGRWLGKGFGATRQAEIAVARGITPPAGSSVAVRHIMRVDTLHGVDAVGITFRAVK